ncbi:MAG: T9SS type A sorting domain-containing protein [candidate division Zixibacteria bacterium]
MRLCLLYIFVLVCIFAAGIISADINDFLISRDISNSEQNNPSIAVGLGGKFAVIWYDYRFGNGDVYGRLYDSGASPIDDAFLINDDINKAWQINPELSSDWFGNYYASWQDYRNEGYPFSPDIYFQKLDSTGVIGINSNITIEVPDTSHQSPAIGSAGWGKSVVAWTDLRNLNWDVYVQYLDINGTFVGENIRVNDDASPTPQHEPDVAVSPEGWFVAAWYDRRNGDDDVYIQKFDSSGNKIGYNIRVNDDKGQKRQKFPSVGVGGNGTIYVVWTDWRNGNYPENSDIYYQQFDSALNKLGPNIIVNRDGTYASQRDPKVSADRMGNACIIWSDLTISGWDVIGQMIEYSGEFHGDNFPVNLDTPGNQLKGDIALDGYNLYFVWVDSRNGNFDIYGRVKNYNNPTLMTIPQKLEISRDMLEPDPVPVKVKIQNAGYGEIYYRLSTPQSWIELSKDSGSTPDSFYVTINSQGIDYGIHQGVISLIDINHQDSSAVLPVELNITGPMIELSTDTLYFDALLDIYLTDEQPVQITNTGSGNLTWSLSTNAPWINTDISSGIEGDFISVGCDMTQVSAGYYPDYIIFTDPRALNSPESLAVTLTVVDNMPYLTATPDEIFYSLKPYEIIQDSVLVSNLGKAVSQWSVISTCPWIDLITQGGEDDAFLFFSAGSSEPDFGSYSNTIVISDETAYNNPLTVPITLNIIGNDTIFVPPVNVEAGKMFQVQLYLRADSDIKGGVFEFSYDSLYISVDSLFNPVGRLESRVEFNISSDDTEFAVAVIDDPTDTLILPGEYHLCDLYGTANGNTQAVTKFTKASPGDRFYILDSANKSVPAVLDAGEIEISAPLAVCDWGLENTDFRYSLEQNFPNPFNASTTIEFSMRKKEFVSLTVFNLLGQQVMNLAEGEFLPGVYRVDWDGRNSTGRMSASGIYFYRIQTESYTNVKKMVFLK